MESEVARLEGERRQVTVLFCDMEGFTPLAKRLGPEDAYTIINSAMKGFDYDNNT